MAPWRAAGDAVRFAVFSPLIRDAETNATLTRPRMTPSQLRVAGFFRGQLFESRTAVELYPLPDQAAVGLPPSGDPRASVAVRASAGHHPAVRRGDRLDRHRPGLLGEHAIPDRRGGRRSTRPRKP